ncbi:glycosyltransferase family 2 protein [Chloroflexota bacterium]
MKLSRVKQISVLVCTKDRPEKFGRCLKSIVESLQARFEDQELTEIVVVDQSKDDQTRRNTEKYQNIKYIKMKSVGISRARNLGIKNTEAEIIAFTDDDCVVDPNWITTIMDSFEDYSEIDALFGRSLAFQYPDRKVTHITTAHELGYSYRAEDDRGRRCYALITREEKALYDKPCYPASWLGSSNNMACRRSAIERMGLFSEYFGAGSPGISAEDPELAYRFLRLGGKILYSPNTLVYHDAWHDLEQAETVINRYIAGHATLWAFYALQGDREAIKHYRYFARIVWKSSLNYVSYLRSKNFWTASLMTIARSFQFLRGTITGLFYYLLIRNRYYDLLESSE